jgi:hypothetical protein
VICRLLEDETVAVNVIVRPPLYTDQRDLVRRPLAVVEGIMQGEGKARSLIAPVRAVEEVIVPERERIREPLRLGYAERPVHRRR